jgi:hypothetical protein
LKLDITIRWLGITMVLAAVLAYLLILVVPDFFPVLLFVILWSLLFFSWPSLSRRVGFPNLPKPPVPPNPRPAIALRTDDSRDLNPLQPLPQHTMAEKAFAGTERQFVGEINYSSLPDVVVRVASRSRIRVA